MSLHRGIYRKLPDDRRDLYNGLRRQLKLQGDNLVELEAFEERYERSDDTVKIRGKIAERAERLTRDVALAEIGLNAEFAHLVTGSDAPVEPDGQTELKGGVASEPAAM